MPCGQLQHLHPHPAAYFGVEVVEQSRFAGLGLGGRGQLVVRLHDPDGPQHRLLLISLKQALLEELIHVEAVLFQLLHTPEEGQVRGLNFPGGLCCVLTEICMP